MQISDYSSFETDSKDSETVYGIASLQIKVACVDKAGNESNAGTFYANEIAGEWSFDLNFPIVVGAGYTRTVTLSGGETKTYADGDAFIDAYKMEFNAPEHVGEFVAEDGAVAYLFEDGTLAIYVNFAKSVEGTWSNADGVKIALNGEDPFLYRSLPDTPPDW